MENTIVDSPPTLLVNELVEGRDLTKKFHPFIHSSSQSQKETSRKVDSHDFCNERPQNLDDDDYKDPPELKDNMRKRRNAACVTHTVQVSTSRGLEDGYSWRKYGQRDIENAKFPRLYYRCTYRHLHGCPAIKLVQRSDDDPSFFNVTYRRKHICSQAPSSPSSFSSNTTSNFEPGLGTLACHPYIHPEQPENIMLNFQKDADVEHIKPIYNNVGENLPKWGSFNFASLSKTVVDHQQTPSTMLISCKEEIICEASSPTKTHQSQSSFQDSNHDIIQSSSTFVNSSASASQLSFDHQEDTSGTSKPQPYHNSTGSTDIKLGKPLLSIPLHIGRVMDSQGIRPYGRSIVDKCSGLPLVIKVVERALINTSTSPDEVRKLLSSKTLHQVLKFGFDRLGEYERKSCFLYSVLSTANKAVAVSALVDSMIDEGLIIGSMEDARKRGHQIIKHLIHISFLQCTDDGLFVKVPDLICDMALEILSDEAESQMLCCYLKLHKNLLVYSSNSSSDQADCSVRTKFSPLGHVWILKAGEGIIEPPVEEEWKEATGVVLMDNKFSNLPTRPTCSKLLTLFLQRNSCLRVIPPNFFENMSSLQFLNLSKTRIKSLPQSVSNLGCLQVLILRNCERLLCLPSEIGVLKHLLVLDVHGTDICHLPDEIGELPLVHLQVCFYGSMDQDEITMLPSQLISKGFISRLSGLRELSIIIYPGDPRWTDIATDVTREMSNLKLCSLSFHFPEIKHLEHFVNVSPAWLHQTLTRFNLIVGHNVKRLVSHVSDELEHDYNWHDRCIRFVDGERIPKAYDGIWKVLCRATAFYLDHHLTALSLTQFGMAAINDLKLCIVRDCPKLKVIFNSQEMAEKCFPFLEFLSIHYLWNLSHIWKGPIQAGSLTTLRRLSVHCCPKLEFILSESMFAVLFNLEELVIEDCQSLKCVIGKEEQVSVDDHTIDGYLTDGDVADFNTIEYDAQDDMEVNLRDIGILRIKLLKLHYLPKLENISNDDGNLPCLEHISVYSCPRLKNLFKSQIEATIKKIKVETTWWNDLKWDDPELPDKFQHCVEEINSDDIWGTM